MAAGSEELQSEMDSADQRPPDEVLVADRFRIEFDSPIKELDRAGAPAYAAEDQRNPSRPLFARVCSPGVLPRVDSMVQLKNLTEARVLHPVEWSPIYWPPERKRSFAVIFERPEHGPLMKSMFDRIDPILPDTLVKTVLEAGIETLVLMSNRGQTHRSIRPDNMFSTGDAVGSIIFGDCVSTPPGWAQPAAFETLEMAMTPHWGRGAGELEDDLYALGASMMFLALGFCPVAAMKDHEIVAAKIQNGSFAALLGGERPPISLREPLRGLLSDNPNERWTADDIEQFLNGTNRRSVSLSNDRPASRPLEFDGKKYFHPRALAHAFADKWAAGMVEVRSELFQKWVTRGVSEGLLDEDMIEPLTDINSSGKETNENQKMSMACLALDPFGPLRYKGLTVQPDGIGMALALAFGTGNRDAIKTIADCLSAKLPIEWLEFREDFRNLDQSNAIKTFKRAHQYLKHTTPGYGIERCLYELQPFAPCLSPVLQHAYVYSLPDLLPALEAVVRDKGALPVLVDRHVIAFVAARTKGQVEQMLSRLDQGKSASLSAKLCIVNLLGLVQQDYGPETVPHLTTWLAGELEPAVEQFRSRSKREEIRRKLKNISDDGKLTRLHNHLNDADAVRRDQTNRAAAEREYAAITTMIAELESEEFHDVARRSGWRIAAGLSTMIAFCTIATLFIW